MIGIFGGSFNPIHMGHLIIAEYVRDHFQLEKVLFVPAKKPPHKGSVDDQTSQHRFNMVQIATSDNPFFDVSAIELNRKGISYTSDTLKELKSLYPNKKLYFICGADSIVNLSTWHSIGSIFAYADMIAVKRFDVNETDVKNMSRWLTDQYNAVIHYCDMPYIEISSTMVRERIKNGLSVRYMVPEGVLKYIQLHRLY
ncbi:MAG TPA: nicotinate-nucleotide adenylyltransferase [Ruminiclostridium sp.]|nr:nicotinate-nucleotide adenylyltransferase [Clostridiaceae bacterium]HAA25466.1 nicotinate-nucleotide adenylyltransferase [Ruminiclostridium sp.]